MCKHCINFTLLIKCFQKSFICVERSKRLYKSSGILRLNVNMEEVYESWFRNIKQNNFNQYFNETLKDTTEEVLNKFLFKYF